MSVNPTMSLQKIRAALLSGDFGDLADLAMETEIFAGHLARSRPDQHLLQDVKNLARRNLPLLEAARKGFADAIERRRQIEDVARGLKTYNQSGKFRPHGGTTRLEQKI